MKIFNRGSVTFLIHGFFIGNNRDHPVFQQGIINQLFGGFAGYLQRKTHTRKKHEIIQRQNG